MRVRAGVLAALGAFALAACGPAAPPADNAPSSPSLIAIAIATATAETAATATATAVVEAPATPAPTPPASTVAQAAVPLNVLPVPRDPPRIAALPRLAGSTQTVVIDPGHAVYEVGAAANGVVEKASNLDMTFRVEALLQAQGVRVLLTRRADERAHFGASDGGFNSTRHDLQARIDLANDAGADVFVSIHSNGDASTGLRGIETYYNSQRPFSDLNLALAATLQSALVTEMDAAGYPVTDRGYKDDSCLRAFQGRCFPLFVLGPPRITTRDEVARRGGSPDSFGFAPGQDAAGSRATVMPASLVELLFISNPADAALLRSEEARDALARGVARGILEYLARYAPRAG